MSVGMASRCLRQLADRDRASAGDVAGGELGVGSHVEHDDGPLIEARGELLAVDDLDAVTVAEVGGGQLLEAGDVGSAATSRSAAHSSATRSLASA